MAVRHYICKSCGTIGRGTEVKRGSDGIERLLYWTLLVPGPFYTLWRLLTKKRICNKCGSLEIVDVDSVEGRILMDKQLRKF